MKERWLPIEGFSNYQISDLGRVKSLCRGLEKILSPRTTISKDRQGSVKHLPYLWVALYIDGKPKNNSVHRLVAQAFLANPENKPQVNHKDRDTLNNKLSNLEWSTPSENVLHSITHFGRTERRGEDNNMSKFTAEQVLEIRRLYPVVKSQRKLAKQFGVTQTAIRQIVNRVHWSHI